MTISMMMRVLKMTIMGRTRRIMNDMVVTAERATEEEATIKRFHKGMLVVTVFFQPISFVRMQRTNFRVMEMRLALSQFIIRILLLLLLIIISPAESAWHSTTSGAMRRCFKLMPTRSTNNKAQSINELDNSQELFKAPGLSSIY